MVIAQHMPAYFTGAFAKALARDTGLTVREGADGMEIEAGTVTILPGGRDSVLEMAGAGRSRIGPGNEKNALVHPSADLLFETAARVAPSVVGVILTGMGRDGSRGAGFFAQKGYPVLVQEPSSCVVGGMPSSAIEAGVASHVLTLEKIAQTLAQWDRGL